VQFARSSSLQAESAQTEAGGRSSSASRGSTFLSRDAWPKWRVGEVVVVQAMGKERQMWETKNYAPKVRSAFGAKQICAGKTPLLANQHRPTSLWELCLLGSKARLTSSET